MPREISPALAQALVEHSTDEGIVILLTATWNAGVLRLAAHPTNVSVDRGGPVDVFTPFDFIVTLPKEGEEAPGTFDIVADNVSRKVVEQIESLSNDVPRIKIELVPLSEVDPGPVTTIEAEIEGKLRSMPYDLSTIRFQVHVGPDYRSEPYPQHRFRFSDGFLTMR